MGLQFFKSVKLGKHLRLNFSKKGISVSTKIGPVTINSNGRKTVNLGNGVKYVSYKKKK